MTSLFLNFALQSPPQCKHDFKSAESFGYIIDDKLTLISNKGTSFQLSIAASSFEMRNDMAAIIGKEGHLHLFDVSRGNYVGKPIELSCKDELYICGFIGDQVIIADRLSKCVQAYNYKTKILHNIELYEKIIDCRAIVKGNEIFLCALVQSGIVVVNLGTKREVVRIKTDVTVNTLLSNGIYLINEKEHILGTFEGNKIRLFKLDRDLYGIKEEVARNVPETVLMLEILQDGIFVVTEKGAWALYKFDGNLIAKNSSRCTPTWLCPGRDMSYFIHVTSDRLLCLELSKVNTFTREFNLNPSDTRNWSIQGKITALCTLYDEFVLVGHENGLIQLHRLSYLFNQVPALIREFMGHRMGISCLMAPTLGTQTVDLNSSLPWFLSGSVDGSVRLWDIKSSECLKRFNIHTDAITRIVQPDAGIFYKFESSLNAPVSASEIHDSLKNHKKPTHFSLMQKSLSKNSIPSMNSSQSFVSSDATRKLTETILKCFFVVTQNGNIAVVDWDQGKVGWWIGGLDHGDEPVLVECIEPLKSNSQHWSGGETLLTYEDFKLQPGDGHLLLHLQGKTSSAVWLIDGQSAICVCRRAGIHAIPGALLVVEFKQKKLKEATKSLIVHVNHQAFPIVSINVKNLIQMCNKVPKASRLLSYFMDIVRSLLSALGFWELDDEEYTHIMTNDLSVERMALECNFIPVISVKAASNRFSFALQRFQGDVECAKVPGSTRFLMSLILLKLLESCDGLESSVSKIITKIFHVLSNQLGKGRKYTFCLTFLSKYYIDPFPEVNSSCRMLVSLCMETMTINEYDLMFEEWFPCLPSLQYSHEKSMAQACIILAALLVEQDRLGHDLKRKNTPPYILGDSKMMEKIVDKDSIPGGIVKLSQMCEQQLLISLISLLISSTKFADGQDEDAKSTTKLHRLIAVEFLGKLWSHWEYFLMNLTTGHLINSTAVQTKGDAPLLSLAVFVLRKLWPVAGHSTKELESPEEVITTPTLPRHVVYANGRRRKSFRKRANSIHLSMAELDKKKDLDLSIQMPDTKKPQVFKSIVPLIVEPIKFDADRIFSPKLFIISSRNTLVNIIKSTSSSYINILCSEILNGGLRDGDWERVRIVMKVGLGLILKQRPIALFPTFIPQVIDSIVRGTLDPNIPFGIREKLSPVITGVIHDLIRVFPTITFHAETQKLCIGTASEGNKLLDFSIPGNSVPPGSLIIWDLKTATKVQLIDAHQPHSISAVAFNKSFGGKSADQNVLLATYSMEGGCVKFWQQHSGFLSVVSSAFSLNRNNRAGDGTGGFFNHLAGGGLIKAFREFPVEHVAENTHNSTGDGHSSASMIQILQQVRFEWVSERKVILNRIDPFPSLTFTV